MRNVLVHVKHVWDPKTKSITDKQRWIGCFEHPEDARQFALDYADEQGIINKADMPLHVWWQMAPEPEVPRAWWLSNEFGPNDKGVGNTFRIYSMESAK